MPRVIKIYWKILRKMLGKRLDSLTATVYINLSGLTKETEMLIAIGIVFLVQSVLAFVIFDAIMGDDGE